MDPMDLAQLKFIARTGCSGVEATLEKWKQSNGICKLCTSDCKDTLEHYILYCSNLLNAVIDYIEI